MSRRSSCTPFETDLRAPAKRSFTVNDTRGGRERAERDRDDGGGEVIDRRRGMEKRLEKVGFEGEGSVVGIEVNEVEGNFQFLQQ